ncbi:sulfurtransferase [Kitasatospora atroaurantiaca]|uniref:Sulfurtransferase n=2 Tax=Kitasatospora atroaurantiaca TaxID=285545 RepID=A0A561EWG7_9ACTN|nr:sulfurtransferase [Kitasatospora atroaurantiaca]TWE19927.1 thiosulfate/3-mercaptopyruvate sulfurtransferase [Kitasatospora atroaurantiaca]
MADMTSSPLISVTELAAALDSSRPPVLLDIRWQLGGPPGAEEYAAGHLPGAYYVDLDRELASPPGVAGRHPLPDPEVLGGALRRAGVSSDRPVVVYDAGPATSAARAWWLLRWAGHPEVRVLDGGLAAWRAAGLPETTEVPPAQAGDFKPVPGQLPTLDAARAAGLAREGLLLDARAGERYRGEVEPVDPRAGHIPGAVSAPTTENLAADGRFLAPAVLAERFRGLGAADRRVGVYCGSGVTAAHELLALEVAGFRGVALYPGSWSEWSANPDNPVATTELPG